MVSPSARTGVKPVWHRERHLKHRPGPDPVRLRHGLTVDQHPAGRQQILDPGPADPGHPGSCDIDPLPV